MPRVVHFEIPVDDPERAREFYTEVFDWQISSWGGPADYWLCTTGGDDEPGIDGALLRRDERPDVEGVVNTIEVPSIDDAMKAVEAAGGQVVQGKMPIPGVGFAAYFEDTEGNRVGLFETATDTD